jgi:GNAT superfamily N-acetyltransferase
MATRSPGSPAKSATGVDVDVDVRPVTAETWDDFARLFEAKGSPHYCWCTPFRVRGNPDLTSAERKAVTRRLVDAATPIGVLAYAGGEPVGWCSIAPRETYVRLESSRTMPRVTPPATATWTILCFFIARSRRGQGIPRALLDGAVRYAQKHGARVVEGYPFDSAGVSSTHRGHSSAFAAAGFRQDGKRWYRELGQVQSRP